MAEFDISIATDQALAEHADAVYLGIQQDHRWFRPYNGSVPQRESDNKATSEGTGYLGDFAASFRDRQLLDQVEYFRINTLQRKNWYSGSTQQWRANTANQPDIYAPNLHAWDFRYDAVGGDPAQSVHDWNWATDADVDIFKYLWKASWIWPDGPYLARALAILGDLKKYAFVPYKGGYLQTTDEFQTQVTLEFGWLESFIVVGPGHHNDAGRFQAEVNPSYIDFNFYKAAKQATNDPFWDLCAVGAKAFLEEVTTPGGSLPTSSGMAPNWCAVDENGDAYKIETGVKGWTATRDTNHTYDAFRTEARMAQYVRNYGDPDVIELLTPLADWYKAEWTASAGTAANRKIAAEHNHAGGILSGGYDKAMMTAAALHTIEAVYGKSDAVALEIRANKHNVTRLKAPSDGTGYSYWRDNPTDNGGTNISYFTDMWVQYAVMADAGLLINYGQEEVPEGHLSLTIVDDGTSQDVIPLKFTDDVPPPVVETGTIDCEQWYWVSSKGRTIDLSKFVDGVEAMAAIEGRGEPSLRQTTMIVPGEPGQFTTEIQHGPREILFPLHASGRRLDVLNQLPSYADPEELEDVLVELVKAMDPVGDGSSAEAGVGTLRLIRRNGRTFELTGRVMTDGLKVRESTHHLGFEQLSLAILCDDPYWYSETITLPFYGSQPRGWFPMLRAGEAWLSSSAILGDANFVVDSDVPTDPIWVAFGPGTTPIITNLDNPVETIEFIDDMPDLLSGEIMTINTREGTVTGPQGQDWFEYLKPGSRNMFPLRPGENNISMDLVGAASTSYISVSYRNKQVIPR